MEFFLEALGMYIG